jgi:hypothetical protein
VIVGALLAAAGLAIVVWNRAVPELAAAAATAATILGVYYTLRP